MTHIVAETSKSMFALVFLPITLYKITIDKILRQVVSVFALFTFQKSHFGNLEVPGSRMRVSFFTS